MKKRRERHSAVNNMIIKSAELETVIGTTSAIPQNDKPEFAFAGKSNVGKSSLINALLNRKALARTSSKPGKTRTINFYNINNELYLVDLPGYGFAQVSKTEQAAWGRMIDKYLERSGQLRQVFLLIDIRHAPGENDVEMYNWIVEKGFQPVIIATKSDKIKRSQLAKQLKLICDTLGVAPGTPVIPFSAENKSGREEILRFFEL